MAETTKRFRKKIRLLAIERALFKMVIPFLVDKIAKVWQIQYFMRFSGFTSVPYEYVIQELESAVEWQRLWRVTLQHFGRYTTHVYFLAKPGTDDDWSAFQPVYISFGLPHRESCPDHPSEDAWEGVKTDAIRLSPNREAQPILLDAGYYMKGERGLASYLRDEEARVRALIPKP